MLKIQQRQISKVQAWILAARPKTLTAAVIPVLVGSVLAFRESAEFSGLLCLCILLSAVSIQVGTNLVNDALDYKKGADTNQRLGPLRVTQAGLLSPNLVMAGAFASFAAASVAALPLLYVGGIPLFALLILSVLCGYLYTGGPAPLAYLGLGDLFVILFFGLIATSATYFLQTGELSCGALIAGLQVGLLAAAMIAINNLRDHEQDRKAGKKTCAVRFGILFSRSEIAFLSVFPYFLGLYWFFEGRLFGACLPLLTAPLTFFLVWQVAMISPSERYNALLGLAAFIHASFGILLILGVW